LYWWDLIARASSVSSLLYAMMAGRRRLMQTAQARLVQQSLVHELARDTYARRRDERRSLTPELKLARMAVMIDETMAELAVVRRDIATMIDEGRTS
jgi:cytidylate kinase